MSDRTYTIKSIMLFFIAAVFRLILGFIFLGGIDLRSYAVLAHATINHSLPTVPFFNYFPLGAFYWWFAGWLHVKTSLPYALSFKIIPIFFDALLAVLIYRMVLQNNKSSAFACGFLYACAPIALIIDCMHGQWEPVFLFFLLLSFYIRDFYADSFKKYIVVGVLFTLSFLIKPLSMIFVPLLIVARPDLWRELQLFKRLLFFMSAVVGAVWVCSLSAAFLIIKTRGISLMLLVRHINCWGGILGFLLAIIVSSFILGYMKVWPRLTKRFKEYLLYHASMIISIIITFCLAVGLFMCMRFDMIALVDTILRCFNQGSQIIGLPFAWPFSSHSWLAVVVKNRIWFVVVLAWITLLYYKGCMKVSRAIFLMLVFILGFTGVSPQYLMWVVPFMLVEEHFFFSAFYNLIVMIALLLYYANPYSNPWATNQNILSFAVLKGFDWLVPPSFFLNAKWITVMRFFSDYGVPLLCGLFFFLGINDLLPNQKIRQFEQNRPIFNIFSFGFLLINMAIGLGILVLMLVTPNNDLVSQFNIIKTVKMQAYDLQPGGTLPIYGDFCWFNIVFILFLVALLWSMVALWYGYAAKKRVK